MMRWFFTICLLVTGLLCSPGARTDDIVELRARADQGDATAQFNLGNAYHAGKGVVQDYQQALFWVGKAADQGDARYQTPAVTDIYAPSSACLLVKLLKQRQAPRAM